MEENPKERLDWEKIKKKYPLAFEKYLEWVRDKKLFTRYLYDFFDEQGIYLEIEAPFGDTVTGCYWDWDIVLPEVGSYQYYRETAGPNKLKTRREAEVAGFMEMFEILEKQLKKKVKV